jgi:DNA invertase Pin-like site-specific DNA recombinase
MALHALLKVGCAYIRVSDERQDEYSPDSQLKKIREYAAKEGYTIPDEYVFYDDGISGKSVKKRNDFQRMIAYAKEKDRPFEAIFVWKFSRFARNQEEAIVYKNLLAKKGVSVISVSEPIPEGAFGSLIERIIEWMDQYYLINLSAEVQRGMAERVSRGYPVCAAPYGYINGNKTYIINEEEAPIVREIFGRYLQGEGLHTIAIELGKRGIKTKQGNKPEIRWVEYILRNPAYCGYLRWSTDGSRSVSKKKYDNDNIMTVKGHHPAIISEDVWNKAQTCLDTTKKMYRKHARREQPVQYMLKGLIRCSACGGAIAMASAKSGKAQVATMQCCNYSHGQCHKSHSITMPRLEAAVMSGLHRALETQTFTMSPTRKTVEKETPDYDKLIAAEEKRLERAKQAYLAEIDSIEQYAVNKKEIETRIAELEAMRDAECPSEVTDSSVFVEKVKEVVRYLEDEEATAEAKNEALRTILDKIVYNKAEESVSLFFYT